MAKFGVEGKLDIPQYDSDDDLFLPNYKVESHDQLPQWSPRHEEKSFESVSSENEGPPWDRVPVCQLDRNKNSTGRRNLVRQDSIVDGLLEEIYDRWHGNSRDSFDSDTFTECSSTSEVFQRSDLYGNWSSERRNNPQLHRTFLQNQSLSKLYKMRDDLKRSSNQMSMRLIKQLKRRDSRLAKLQRNCDVVTAVIQAASLKRRIDTRMRFSIEPLQSDNAFDQWRDAMKAVARLPMGIPSDFRKKVWLSLADNHIRDLRIDWEKTVRFAFNEKSNPDDNKLGLQIVKDLHRTGCTSFSGHDNEEDRAVLKRVLLAYARWNKRVGYCQGFNIIAALLLDVMDRKEDDALKVMVYLIDHVLPESYFANNLRALSVDMAVFRDLLRMTLPGLSKHLDYLQHAAQDHATGACYEPPLTNVFTMQWFLTLFATCLPKNIVLRVMDSILLEGSEILLRTALTIWGKLARRIMNVPSADEFYTLMGDLTAEMMQGHIFNADSFIKSIYSVAPFPFPNLIDLREKYTYNIRPFTSTQNGSKKQSKATKNVLYSDDDEIDEDDIEAISCFPGMEGQSGTSADISSVGPGAFGASVDSQGHRSPYLERMSTDIHALKKQYEKLRLRQRQAHIIIAGASVKKTPKPKAVVFVPKIESPTAMNHLFIGKLPSGGKNRIVADGPTIAPLSTRSSLLSKQVNAVAKAENRHRRNSSRNNSTNSNSDTLSSAASAETLHDMKEKGDYSEIIEENNCELTETEGISGDKANETEKNDSKVPESPTRSENSDCDASEPSKQWSNVTLHSVRLDNSDTDSINSEELSPHSSSEGEAKPDSEPVNKNTNPSENSSNRQCELNEDGKNELDNENINKPSNENGEKISDARESFMKNGKSENKQSNHIKEEKTTDLKEKQKSECSHVDKVSIPTNEMIPSLPYRKSKHTAILHSLSRSVSLVEVDHKYQTSKHAVSKAPSRQSPFSISPSSPPALTESRSADNSAPPTFKPSKPFNPFPTKHINQNRAKTGLKLGLYSASTLSQLEKKRKSLSS